MSYEAEIEVLESEWTPGEGFFWTLREGHYDAGAFGRALEKVRAMSIAEDDAVPRRMVSLLWYIPIFMQWQVERLQDNKGDMIAYARAIAIMTNEIERLLGVP